MPQGPRVGIAALDGTERAVVENFGVSNLLEALRAGGRATAGDDGEGLLETDPGAEIDLFFRIQRGVWETIVAETEEYLCQRKELARGLRLVPRGARLSDLPAAQAGWPTFVLTVCHDSLSRRGGGAPGFREGGFGCKALDLGGIGKFVRAVTGFAMRVSVSQAGEGRARNRVVFKCGLRIPGWQFRYLPNSAERLEVLPKVRRSKRSGGQTRQSSESVALAQTSQTRFRPALLR